MTQAANFWVHDDTQRATTSILNSNHLALLIGAGVSVDRGLPTWAGLLRALARRCAKDLKAVPRTDRDAFHDALTSDASDLLAAATTISALMGQEWVAEAVRVEFNKVRIRASNDGLLNAITRLIEARRKNSLRTTVITTNFDGLLEDFSKSHKRDRAGLKTNRLKPVYSRLARPLAKDLVPIYHIHGYVGSTTIGDRSDHLVLTSADFAADWTADWSNDVFDEAAEAKSWLLVGMSLADLHILQYLARRAAIAPGATWVLLSKDGREWDARPPTIERQLVRALGESTRKLGAVPLITSWFHEVPLFIEELSLRHEFPDAASEVEWRYDKRLADWSIKTQKGFFGDSALGSSQEALCSAMCEFRDKLVRMLDGHLPSEERFKVELWVRRKRPDAEEDLVCVASSEYMAIHADGRPTASISNPGNFAGAQAFRSGVPRRTETTYPGTRWKSFTGLPVSLSQEPWCGLLVGALVVSSNQALDDSGFVHERFRTREIDQMMLRLAACLDPYMSAYHAAGRV